MKERPLSISIIAWILIGTSALNVVTYTTSLNNPMVKELMAKNPLPTEVQHALLYVGLAVTILSGVLMLKGQNFGRWLYVVWSVFGTVVALATSPMKFLILPGIVVWLVIVFFLFRPPANDYFASEGDSDAHGF